MRQTAARASPPVSARKIAANRKNARASTGPRTAAGKARASRNSLRHGLSAKAWPDPAIGLAIDRLAQVVMRDARESDLAYRFAAAQIDAMRARAAWKRILVEQAAAAARGWSGGDDDEATLEGLRDSIRRLEAVKRHEDRAVRRRKRATEELVMLRTGEVPKPKRLRTGIRNPGLRMPSFDTVRFEGFPRWLWWRPEPDERGGKRRQPRAAGEFPRSQTLETAKTKPPGAGAGQAHIDGKRGEAREAGLSGPARVGTRVSPISQRSALPALGAARAPRAPSPLAVRPTAGGEGWGGGWRSGPGWVSSTFCPPYSPPQLSVSFHFQQTDAVVTSLPGPPPQGGREPRGIDERKEFEATSGPHHQTVGSEAHRQTNGPDDMTSAGSASASPKGSPRPAPSALRACKPPKRSHRRNAANRQNEATGWRRVLASARTKPRRAAARGPPVRNTPVGRRRSRARRGGLHHPGERTLPGVPQSNFAP
jgi:hypothetical protein